MIRFSVVALPLLLLILALFAFGAELAGLTPLGTGVARALLGGATRVPVAVVLGTWVLEATGLLALFLLIEGRCGARWLDGLVTGWIAWIFRGPLVVVTVLGATGSPRPDRWWALALAWWLLYSICGLALAILAGRPTPAAAASPERGAPPFEAEDSDEGRAPQEVKASAPEEPAPPPGRPDEPR